MKSTIPFKINIYFSKFCVGHIVPCIIPLNKKQLEYLQHIPPYYDYIKIVGYVRSGHWCVEHCYSNAGELTSKQFDELMYESYHCGEWLINKINDNMNKILDFSNLTESEQKKIKKLYEDKTNIQLLETIFGEDFTDNRPKTWTELKKELKIFNREICLNYPSDIIKLPQKYLDKVEAYFKLQILIDYSYGGNITDAEASFYDRENFWGIICNEHTGALVVSPIEGCKVFPAFHTQKQADKFISYSENKELVRQFYQS